MLVIIRVNTFMYSVNFIRTILARVTQFIVYRTLYPLSHRPSFCPHRPQNNGATNLLEQLPPSYSKVYSKLELYKLYRLKHSSLVVGNYSNTADTHGNIRTQPQE